MASGLANIVLVARPINFRKFRQSVAAQGLQMLCVELVFGEDTPFQLTGENDPAAHDLSSKMEAGTPTHLGTCARVYLVPQTLYKLHPSFDAVLYALLRRDRTLALKAAGKAAGQACVVAPQGAHREWTGVLRRRMRRAFLELALRDGGSSGSSEAEAQFLASRVLLVPTMRQHRFFELIAAADVVLDPFPLGGGRSSLEIFASGSASASGGGATREGCLSRGE